MPPTATDSAFNTPVSAAVVVTQDDSEDTDNGDSPACSKLSPFHRFKPIEQGGMRFFAESSLRDGLISVLSHFGIHDLVLGLGANKNKDENTLNFSPGNGSTGCAEHVQLNNVQWIKNQKAVVVSKLMCFSIRAPKTASHSWRYASSSSR